MKRPLFFMVEFLLQPQSLLDEDGMMTMREKGEDGNSLRQSLALAYWQRGEPW